MLASLAAEPTVIEWRDEGIVLGARSLGERDVVLSVMTFGHGRHAGLVRGGAGKRLGGLLQAGNRLELVWSARLEAHLGAFSVAPVRLHAARVMGDGLALLALGAAVGLVELAAPERQAHELLYAALLRLVEDLRPGPAGSEVAWLETYVRFELVLLAELGFALDLEKCAVTGVRSGLAYVSPRTGRAVSREAAGDFVPRLLPLPGFLTGEGEANDMSIAQGLQLAGHFLSRHILEPMDRMMPVARERLVAAVSARGMD